MTHPTSLDFLKETVEPAIFDNLSSAFPEFGWSRTSRGWKATSREFTKDRFGCRPDRVVCLQSRGFYIHGDTPHGISWVEYLSGDNAPVGEQFREAVRDLAKKAGVDPSPLNNFSPKDQVAYAEVQRRETTRDHAWAFFKTQLRSPTGASGLKYLRGRGITDEDLEHLEIGFYPSDLRPLKEDLLKAGHSMEEMEASGVLHRPFGDRIIGAWKDRSGRIGDFWARSIREGQSPKYLRLPSAQATPEDHLLAYGLDTALGTQEGRENLILVEGMLDVAVLHARGFLNVAAVGATASKLSASRWERLHRYGVKSVTLAMDNDPSPASGLPPGLKGTLAALQNFLKASRSPVVHVLDPAKLSPSKDPDELIRSSPDGIDIFRSLLEERQTAFGFQANHLLQTYAPNDAWTDLTKREALDEAIHFTEIVLATHPERATDLDIDFWQPLVSKIQVDPRFLETRIQAVRERVAREVEVRRHKDLDRHQKEAYSSLVEEARQILDEGRLAEARSLLRNQLGHLRAEERHLSCEPIRSVSEELAENEASLERWRGSEFIGLCQETIPRLDRATSGLRGLMLLAAAPNAGKTAMAAQLGLDIVTNDPNACFLFLSLEMPRQSIITRMKCRLAHLDWDTLVFGSQKGRGRGREVSFTPAELDLLLQMEKKLDEIGQRICILDEKNFPEPTTAKILAEIEALKTRTGASRAFVLIDYLQVWPIPRDIGPTIRTELDADKWRIGEMKTLRDELDQDAVMVISEARKPSGQSGDSWGGALADVMGSARGSYTPDMVFLLRTWSDLELADHFDCLTKDRNGKPAIDKDKLAQVKADLFGASRSLCKFVIAKGRDGVFRDTFDLTFHYKQTRFEEGIRA